MDTDIPGRSRWPRVTEPVRDEAELRIYVSLVQKATVINYGVLPNPSEPQFLCL